MNSNIFNKTPQFNSSEADTVSYFNENGFHIERDVFSSKECSTMIKESENFENSLNKSYIPEQQVHKKNKVFLNMMKNNKIKKIIDKFSSKGKEMFGIQSSFFYGVPNTSGASNHQDGLWVKPEDASGFISAWTPLIDLDNTNMGNLYVYEKSHKEGSLNVIENKSLPSSFQNEGLVKYESVLKKNLKKHLLTVKKGSTVFLHSNLVHGSIGNSSEKNRYVVLFTYIRDGISFREGREAKREKTSLK